MNKRIGTYLTQPQVDHLEQLSIQTQLSVADLVRRAVDRFLAHPEGLVFPRQTPWAWAEVLAEAAKQGWEVKPRETPPVVTVLREGGSPQQVALAVIREIERQAALKDKETTPGQ